MKPLSVEITCLLGVQNKVQVVCRGYGQKNESRKRGKGGEAEVQKKDIECDSHKQDHQSCLKKNEEDNILTKHKCSVLHSL